MMDRKCAEIGRKNKTIFPGEEIVTLKTYFWEQSTLTCLRNYVEGVHCEILESTEGIIKFLLIVTV